MTTERIQHGGRNDQLLQRYGLRYEDLTDFSSNINSHGPDPRIVQAVTAHDFSNYPDPDAAALRELIAEHHHLERTAVIVGNGSTELMALAAQALLSPGETVLIVGPTFGEYRRLCEQNGAVVRELRATEADRFAFPDGAWEETLRTVRPRICFLCRPNNPTGVSGDERQLRASIDDNPATLFIVDEAYLPFARNVNSLLPSAPPRTNLIVLRSLTKSHSLAGLRLGYLVTNSTLRDRIDSFRSPWNVNSAAQAAGEVIFSSGITMHKSLAQSWERQRDLITDLSLLGIDVIAHVSAYALLRVARAMELFQALLEHRILVRPCHSFGLSNFLRVSTRSHADHQRLLDVVKRHCS